MQKGFTFNPVKKEKIEKAFNKALFALKEQALTDCNSLAKKDQGVMIDTSYAEVGDMQVALIWNTPYARFAYYTGTPSIAGRELKWAEKAHARYGKEWRKILEKGMAESL